MFETREGGDVVTGLWKIFGALMVRDIVATGASGERGVSPLSGGFLESPMPAGGKLGSHSTQFFALAGSKKRFKEPSIVVQIGGAHV